MSARLFSLLWLGPGLVEGDVRMRSARVERPDRTESVVSVSAHVATTEDQLEAMAIQEAGREWLEELSGPTSYPEPGPGSDRYDHIEAKFEPRPTRQWRT